ncbi:MAG: ABC transporter permease [Acidobacteriaceae bacterium]|nr:ABC transporter permease [Acidobacteriaceae bacterium]
MKDEATEEIQQHLLERTEGLMGEGLSHSEALSQAKREFGNVTLIQEQSRETWNWSTLESCFGDARFALRSLGHSPGFSALSILILALGIGLNAAIFSVVHGVILRPLSYRDPGRLVSISMIWPDGERYGQISGPDFLDFSSQSSAFESTAAYANDVISVVAHGHSEFSGASAISEHFLQTLGVEPCVGRAFLASDFLGKPRVAMVSLGFWERHFGNVPFTAGQILKTAGTQLEIIGLLPSGFHFPESSHTEVWFPFFESLRNVNRGAHNYQAIGRLKPGISLEQAQAQLTAIATRLQKEYPGTNQGAGVYVTSLTNFTVRDVKASLYALIAAVGLVLLIACANIANLLLARGAGRLRELAVRTALGASQARIVRQLFTETLILAGAGCAAGILFAKIILPALLALTPGYIPRLNEIRIDLSTLRFCAACGLLASLLFGVAPTLQGFRVDPNHHLHANGARGVVGTGRLRHMFITAEIALSTVLLVSAGLLLRSFSETLSVDLGFSPQKLLVGHVSIPSGNERRATDKVFRPLLEQLSTNGQFQSVALAHGLPAQPESRSTAAYIIEGQTLTDMNNSAPQAGDSVVSGSYFSTLRIPLLAGRTFSEHDNASSNPVVIVDRAFVRRSYPTVNPIGRSIRCGFDPIAVSKWATIIGVVSDAHMDGPTQSPMPEIYFPYLQHPRQELDVIVRQSGQNPLSGAPFVRSTLQRLDSEAAVKFTTMENHLADVVATSRFSSILIAVFAGLAILLASIGIYGVISYSVSQRKTEIGVRMALGADRWSVVRMILIEAVRLCGIGLLIGSTAAETAARLLQAQLFRVSATEPRIYVGVLMTLGMVAIIAACVPALSASGLEPLEALRQE